MVITQSHFFKTWKKYWFLEKLHFNQLYILTSLSSKTLTQIDRHYSISYPHVLLQNLAMLNHHPSLAPSIWPLTLSNLIMHKVSRDSLSGVNHDLAPPFSQIEPIRIIQGSSCQSWHIEAVTQTHSDQSDICWVCPGDQDGTCHTHSHMRLCMGF